MIGAELRRAALEISYKRKTGHLGSILSVIDIIWCLYKYGMNIAVNNINDSDRNRFVMSKGHPALALYTVLYKMDLMSKAVYDTYCEHSGTKLAVHPKHSLDGVDFSTGSLGQGATFAVGAALAAKIQNSSRKIYCLISDGELNEGSVWEAFMFAGHHKLDNLVFLCDNNGQQALDKTSNVINVSNLRDRITSFGLQYLSIDGHDCEALQNLFQMGETYNATLFVDCKTICGKGVSFMEYSIPWHYKSLADEQLNQALSELI